MNFIKRIINFFVKLFILIWETIKTMKTKRGILSLFLSFMIFVGWAYVFIVIGTISSNATLVAIGTTVALFWIGPFTPLFPIIILCAFLFQRYIFHDRSNDDALKNAIKNFKETGFKSEEDLRSQQAFKIKTSRLHSYKKLYQRQAKRGYYEFKRK